MKKVVLLALLVSVSTAFAAALVNINTADLTTLETLNGIGPSKAQAIIDYRTQHGAFSTISDIQNVSGIGTATYNNIKDFITVGDTSQSQTQATSSADSSTTTQAQAAPSQTQTQSAPVSSYVPPPQPDVFADAGADRTVIVGADTEFDGRAYDRRQVLLDKVRYMWNFGDGSTAEGQAVLHHYEYPGRYAVVLNIAAGVDSVGDQLIVTAEPARLGFAVNSDGSVSIENNAGRDLDLSRWIVRSFNETFTLPAHSIILSGQTMRISHTTLGFTVSADSELDYPNGVRALRANEISASTAPLPSAPAQSSAPSVRPVNMVSAPRPSTPAPSVGVQSASAATADAIAPDATDTQLSQSAAAAEATGGISLWWLAVAGLIAVGGGGVYAVKYVKAGEWDITEG